MSCPTTIGDLTPQALRSALATGLRFRVGAFNIAACSTLPTVAEGVAAVYPDYPVLAHDAFIDFAVKITAPFGVRAVLRPQVQFLFDGYQPFKPLPQAQAFPLMEWGLNWCASNHAHQYVISHAAVVEKNGRALIMPGTPGSGKSTLCAALIQRGWRLLSDELTLVSLDTLEIVPMCRPVSLKNESIQIIQDFEKTVTMGHASYDTSKGTVAHMRAPTTSVLRSQETAVPAWVVFPKYEPGVAAQLDEHPKASACMKIAENTFNYSMLGLRGFQTVSDLIDQCACYTFNYSNLDDAVTRFNHLAQQ